MGGYNSEDGAASSSSSGASTASSSSSSDVSSWSADFDAIPAAAAAAAAISSLSTAVSAAGGHQHVGVGDRRERKFERLLLGGGGGLHAPRHSSAATAKKELRPLCWSGGAPDRFRAEAWRVLLDYTPVDPIRRAGVLRRKREEYTVAAERCYGRPVDDYCATRPLEEELLDEGGARRADATASSSGGGGAMGMVAEIDLAVLRQVRKDVPRTVPDLALFRDPRVQARLERVLYVWAHRNPAAGYVQGMNDVAVPFFIAFLTGAYHHWDDDGSDSDSCGNDSDNEHEGEGGRRGSRCPDDDFGSPDEIQPPRSLSDVPSTLLDAVESDVYWCLSRLLSGMQDHYTPHQPGIFRMIANLEDVLAAIDPALSDHLHTAGVKVLHFAFRWMNCLLVRELPLKCVLRLFDAYLSEEEASGRDELHVYVCAALLVKHSVLLRTMDHDALFEALTTNTNNNGEGARRLPLEEMTTGDVEEMLGQAHVWRTTFGGSRARIECARREQRQQQQQHNGDAAQVDVKAAASCSSQNPPPATKSRADAPGSTSAGGLMDRALSALTGVDVGALPGVDVGTSMSDANFLCY